MPPPCPMNFISRSSIQRGIFYYEGSIRKLEKLVRIGIILRKRHEKSLLPSKKIRAISQSFIATILVLLATAYQTVAT
jgi:TolB-like protein